MDQVHSIKEDRDDNKLIHPLLRRDTVNQRASGWEVFLIRSFLCDLTGRGPHSILLGQQDE